MNHSTTFRLLLIGLILGGFLDFGYTNYVTNTKPQTANTTTKPIDTLTSSAKWIWSDSLDPMRAAPENHKLVYEDDNVRVLVVMLDGTKSEPIHTCGLRIQ